MVKFEYIARFAYFVAAFVLGLLYGALFYFMYPETAPLRIFGYGLMAFGLWYALFNITHMGEQPYDDKE